jgi:hypothetical protein
VVGWVLIIMLAGSQGVAINSQSFTDKASCEVARDAVLKEWQGDTTTHAHAVCEATATKKE